MKKNLALVLVFFLFIASCSQNIKASQTEVIAQRPNTYEELWQATYLASLEYTLHDFSKIEGSIESNWIYEGDLNRYRFFISIDQESDPIDCNIDIQSQTRKAKDSKWQWVEPSIDKEERLKNKIHENIKKIRAT